jgi:hypothetical protein
MHDDDSLDSKLKSAIQYLVAAPLLHLTMTALFLIGYHSSVGHKLYLFSSAGDFFSVSIGEIGPAYISIVGIPMLYILFVRIMTGSWTSHEAALSIQDEEKRERALSNFQKDRKVLLWFVHATFLMWMAVILWTGRVNGYVSYMAGYIAFCYIFFFVNVRAHSKSSIPSYWMHITSALGLILGYSYFAGLSHGQQDRYISYKEAIKVSPLCADKALLRSIGENYFAIRKDGRHVVLTKNCQEVAQLSI